MRVDRSTKPGWFFNGQRQYLALSHVSKTLNIPASEVEDAVTTGKLKTERISGCKAVLLEDLFGYVETRAGK